jgi:hypothetical protein
MPPSIRRWSAERVALTPVKPQNKPSLFSIWTARRSIPDLIAALNVSLAKQTWQSAQHDRRLRTQADRVGLEAEGQSCTAADDAMADFIAYYSEHIARLFTHLRDGPSIAPGRSFQQICESCPGVPIRL